MNEDRSLDDVREPVTTQRIACSVCQREIPLSEAIVPEASDYVAHFCGLDCYASWRLRSGGLIPSRR